MANSNPNDEDNDLNQPGSNPNQNQPGQSNTSTSQPGSAYAPTKTGSGFTNIQRVIGANSQNQLGQAVGGGVTNAANRTGQNINQAQQQFTEDTNANNLDTDANRGYINSTYQNIQNQAIPGQQSSGSSALDTSNAAANMYTPTGSTTANAPYDPSKDASKFAQFTSGQYQGPQNLSNLNNLQSQATDVNNLQNSLNSQEGRQGLLQRFVGGNGQYTQGEQNLDALLLGQTGGKQLSKARLATQALPDINNLAQANQATAQTMQNRAQDLANFTKTGAQTAAGNINANLTSQAAAQQSAAHAQFEPLMQRINSGALTADDQSTIKNLLGLDPSGPIYGTKDQIMMALTKGIQEGQYNNSNVANQQQYSSQQALQQLSGLNGNDLGLNLDESQIGKAGPALSANEEIKKQLLNSQQQGAQKFKDDYAKSGILSQEELDYMNDPTIQAQLHNIGGALNAYDQQDYAGQQRAMEQVHGAEDYVNNLLHGFDTQHGQTGFGQYANSINDIGNYGGQRSYARGEGVSGFLNNINQQQQQRQALEKQDQYFSNLSSMLANNSNPGNGKVSAF